MVFVIKIILSSVLVCISVSRSSQVVRQRKTLEGLSIFVPGNLAKNLENYHGSLTVYLVQWKMVLLTGRREMY